jgi:hypothetical protein
VTCASAATAAGVRSSVMYVLLVAVPAGARARVRYRAV